MNARRRLRLRREDAAREVELAKMSTEVRNAWKDMKGYLGGLERDWWNERILQCENAYAQERLGDMYTCLRKIGTRGKAAGSGMDITGNKFKDQFKRVPHERYEEKHRVIERAVRRANDLREWR